ncbi:MAG: phosphate ABC transporter substrate-binding protein [Niameybacter sp.]|uniref:phosphate ABC transporter substrate-binding protein n=1 Tax=Niameybacter sp. TaxID=2033640 RepID=UPI002FC7FA39
MKNKFLRILGVATIGMAMLTGCASGTADSTPQATGSSAKSGGKIVAVGSTTVAVPMEDLAKKYKEEQPDVVIEVQGVGSSAGVKAAHDGTANIGMVSRELKAEEANDNFDITTIAYDGIAVVVNPANGVTDLTKEQIKDIFEGTITNWSEVGGADQPVIVVSREDGSGTRGAFEEILKLEKEIDGKTVSSMSPGALIAEGNGTMKATVASKEGAVGFVSLGFIDDTVKAVSVDGVEATVESVKDGSFAISRPLLILTNKEESAETKEFVEFILGDAGQEIVSEKYISIK